MVNLKKGFTLIELLVVIAIIGILSSVVLASLNTARGKGADAAIKSNLNNVRAQAELFYDTANNYTGVCAASGSNVIGPGVTAANTASGVVLAVSTVLATAGSATQSVCHVDATGSAWAASVPLKTSTANSWCVDSSGQSKQLTGAHLLASSVVCQ